MHLLGGIDFFFLFLSIMIVFVRHERLKVIRQDEVTATACSLLLASVVYCLSPANKTAHLLQTGNCDSSLLGGNLQPDTL